MTKNEINETVKTIRELKRMQEELLAEIAAQEDKLKAEMDATHNYTMNGDDFKVTWNNVTVNKLDVTALRQTMPEIAERFERASTFRRFCII